MAGRLIGKFSLHADAGRAIRTAMAFGIPIAVCMALHRTGDAAFISLTAQTIAMQDLRGAYGVRLAIIAVMMCAAAGAAMLGVLAGGNAAGAVLAMGFIALLSGVWRHLSTDYGPPH